jgi:DNA helicase-2/ATP-dependent DNA helicase PcrA
MWVGTFHGIAHRLLRAALRATPTCPQPSRSSIPTTSCADQARREGLNLDENEWPRKEAQWFINAQQGRGPASAACRRPAAIPACCQTMAHLPPTKTPASARAWSISPSCCCARTSCGATSPSCSPITANASARAGGRVPGHQRHPVRLAANLLAGDGNMFVVGDDDQSIYGWRGARVENMQRFARITPAPDDPAGTELPLHRQHPGPPTP